MLKGTSGPNFKPNLKPNLQWGQAEGIQMQAAGPLNSVMCTTPETQNTKSKWCYSKLWHKSHNNTQLRIHTCTAQQGVAHAQTGTACHKPHKAAGNMLTH